MIKLNDIQIKVTKILGEEFGANMEKILKVKGFEGYKTTSPKSGKSIPTYNYFSSLKFHGSEERLDEIKNGMIKAEETKQARIKLFIDRHDIMTAEEAKKLDYFRNKKPQLIVKIIDGVLSLPLLGGKIIPMVDIYDFEIIPEKIRKPRAKKAKNKETKSVDTDEFDEFAVDEFAEDEFATNN